MNVGTYTLKSGEVRGFVDAALTYFSGNSGPSGGRALPRVTINPERRIALDTITVNMRPSRQIAFSRWGMEMFGVDHVAAARELFAHLQSADGDGLENRRLMDEIRKAIETGYWPTPDYLAADPLDVEAFSNVIAPSDRVAGGASTQNIAAFLDLDFSDLQAAGDKSNSSDIEDAGMLPDTSKQSDIAHNENGGQAAATPQEADLARRFMIINQDMASFGVREDIDAKLQDRVMADPIAFYA